MRKTKLSLLLLACILAITVFTGCQKSADNNSDTFAVVDMTGREISLDAPATKIVALSPSDCEIIYALNAGETIVGRGEYCNYPQEVSNAPIVQSGSETNVEEIIALKPQVVVMSNMAQTDEQVKALENAGIQVVISDAQDINGVYTAIELMGKVVGNEKEAAALISDMKKSFKEITDKVTENSGKTVYFEVSPLEYGLWAAGKGTFMDEIATMLGVTNAFADVEGWAEISEEQIIERSPDYIVTITMYFGEGTPPVDEIKNRKGWGSIKAIANDKVLNADSDKISRPGPRLADAAKELYEFVYEE
ncbi:ABC transporter substrate-binding protein [Hydrogenoanaerobacterium sp.]|uniref:ABC transporter substrate-binding protein n=1 Tax=Hydrogenoanaerobacterium sp. TaxID=2953763 RepID=UPI0028980949|nr:ABC transporter substrate-binding protein [Hydrogenoanaerobacterium sp.]